jgi:hypothetical protein
VLAKIDCLDGPVFASSFGVESFLEPWALAEHAHMTVKGRGVRQTVVLDKNLDRWSVKTGCVSLTARTQRSLSNRLTQEAQHGLQLRRRTGAGASRATPL